jgi:flagellar biosynthesis/type III secretory pathway M-ring protein FliF/YscJ
LAEILKKPSCAEKIEKFIDKNPEAVAQLLRNWLVED